MTIQTLTLTLSHPIRPNEVARWRGAFLETIGWEEELFHNHANKGYQGQGAFSSTQTKSSKLHYRYPLIQYFEQNRKGTIVGIQEGATALAQLIQRQSQLCIQWNGQDRYLQIESVQEQHHTFQMYSHPKTYHLHRWLALTQKNYLQWKKCHNLVERIQLLDRLLVNHLIALFKGLEWDWPERLEARLQFLHWAKPIRFKGQTLQAFEITFTANVDLPIGIGIGKGVSQGFGMLVE